MVSNVQNICHQINSECDRDEITKINAKICSLFADIIQNERFYHQFVYEVENGVLTDADSMNQRFLQMFLMIQNMLSGIQDVQNIVIHNRLGKWKREQVLGGIGGDFSNDVLDQIQKWFEALADVILNSITLIETIKSASKLIFCSENLINGINMTNDGLLSLLQQLVKSSFIVEEQPYQIMEINKK